MWNDILQDIASQSEKRGQIPDPTPKFLRTVWPAVVGDAVARLSSPIRLQDKTLYVEVRTQTLADEWSRSPAPLLRRLDELSPWSVDRLQICHSPTAGVVDAVEPDVEADTAEANPDPMATAPIDRATDEAIDPELRALIESIHRQRLARDD